MQVKAISKHVGISHRKLGLVADMTRGKKVEDALTLLKFTPTPSARVIEKVVKSAASNAENNFHMPMSDLKIVKVYVNQGATLRRMRPQARGRAAPILKHSSHITVIVDMEG